MPNEYCTERKVTDVTETKLDLTRRNFLSGIATLAATVGLTSLAQTAEAATKKYKVCATKDVKVGGAAIFRIAATGGTIMVMITQPKKGTFRAFNPACTHQGYQIGSIEGTSLVCSVHGARFNSDSGAVVAGPARTALKKYTASVEGTTVYINA
jgi:nitrite reductase/ring-hydroxylating ferredoxin subunit